ncbi:hypothetical protein [Streptomyces caatingaensis]|uniref:Uncharacterized protein n=1 Tax=Streptomyces caatingaensis TaxID=1678637 RepID=A0A0K9XB39_9ACTN|nr:hypothetical protein [Streptomyces caatingaensis]KNB50624.1 hypothetical protein AC230_22125 [Streptomyces caatingaensis]
MTPAEELLRLIGQHADSIRSCLDDDQYDLLLSALRDLTCADGDGAATARAERDVERALAPLPAGHPASPARRPPGAPAAPGHPRPGPAARAWPLLVQLMAGRPATRRTAGIIAAVKRRLLAAPSLSAAEVRDRCAEEPLPGDLIRLADPVRGDRYPAFQFAGETGGPVSVVRSVNQLLLAEVDPWGAADWWLSGNTWLGGPPASFLGELPDEVLASAARALVKGEE